MSMDMTPAITPKSDQINADSLTAGPQTFTVERASQGSDEQPVNIHLVESPGKPYRPGKSMARVMVKAWGKDADAYAGKRLTLYCDPDVTFGREKVGGIRISHMSDLPNGEPLVVSLTATRGQRKPFTVQPLADAPTYPNEPTEAQVAACADDAELRAWWPVSSPERQAQIKSRAADLKGGAV